MCIVASAFCLASPFVRLLLFEDSQKLRCLCKLYEKEKRNTDLCVRVVRRIHERWKEVCVAYGFSRLSLPNESLLSERSMVKANARNERVFRERLKLETLSSYVAPSGAETVNYVQSLSDSLSTFVTARCEKYTHKDYIYDVFQTIICFRIIKEKKTKPMMR